jgi:hypothetical protein
MRESEETGSNVGLGIIVWIAVLAAVWVMVAAITGASGLGLVWGVFAALAAFETTRRSFRSGLVLLFASLWILVLRGLYILVV